MLHSIVDNQTHPLRIYQLFCNPGSIIQAMTSYVAMYINQEDKYIYNLLGCTDEALTLETLDK